MEARVRVAVVVTWGGMRHSPSGRQHIIELPELGHGVQEMFDDVVGHQASEPGGKLRSLPDDEWRVERRRRVVSPEVPTLLPHQRYRLIPCAASPIDIGGAILRIERTKGADLFLGVVLLA